jgi:hypothetical protein
MNSTWWGRARALEGRIVVPGGPHAGRVDLHWTPDGLELKAGDRAGLTLSWEDYDAGLAGTDVSGSWHLTHWAHRQNAVSGLAITGAASRAPEAEPLRWATRGWRNALLGTDLDGAGLPLWALVRPTSQIRRESDTVVALAGLMAARPDLRWTLGDPAVTTDLVADIAHRPMATVAPRSGGRRVTTDVLVAMHELGYVHPLGGRPFPGDVLPERDEAVDRVIARVHGNRWAAEGSDSPEKVAEIIDRDFLDVVPWPFEALAGGRSVLAAA